MPLSTIIQNSLGTGVVGTGPAFSAYMSTNQTVVANTPTKLALNTENFDTASCYDTSLYRFTPNVAGYYQINFVTSTAQGSNLNTRWFSYLYKNGTLVQQLPSYNGTSGDYQSMSLNTVISMNGTTDYLEIYGHPTAQSLIFVAGSPQQITTFSGSLVRAA